MVELETVLAPVSFGDGEPTRFIGMVQVLSDTVQLGGRPIAFERLVGSQLVREDEPMSTYDAPPPPPPAAGPPHACAAIPRRRICASSSAAKRRRRFIARWTRTCSALIRALDIMTAPSLSLVRVR